MRDLFHGTLVRLTSEPPEVLAKADVAWDRDTELHRLGDSDPVRLWSETRRKRAREKQFVENGLQDDYFYFSIRALAGDELIGHTMLRVKWAQADAIMGIGIGKRDYWGRGYGRDALDLILGYGFNELDLRRVTLSVGGHNARAIRLYERAGFQHEGHIRQVERREGRRWDEIWMGILREEWAHAQKG